MDAFTALGLGVIFIVSYGVTHVYIDRRRRRALLISMASDITTRLVSNVRWQMRTGYGILPVATGVDIFDAISGFELHRHTHHPADIFCNISTDRFGDLMLTVRYALNEVRVAGVVGKEILADIDAIKVTVSDFDPYSISSPNFNPVFNSVDGDRYKVFLAHLPLRELIALRDELHEHLPRG